MLLIVGSCLFTNVNKYNLTVKCICCSKTYNNICLQYNIIIIITFLLLSYLLLIFQNIMYINKRILYYTI